MGTSRFRRIDRPHLFAHRGGRLNGNAEENTIKAFKYATALGYKFIETDVITTRDGQVICYHGAHNRYAKRFSGLEIRRKLQKLTYGQLKTKKLLEGEKMPKLEDVLNRFPDVLFSIDVKTKESIRPVAELVNRLGVQDRVIITSFSLWRSLKTNSLLKDKRQASLCLSRFSAKVVSPINTVFIFFIKLLGVKYLQVSQARINRRLIKLARKHGIYVYVWTVNKEKSMRKMLSLGVDGIMSDDIELLQKVAKDKRVTGK